MLSNILYNEIPKRKVVNAINRIMRQKQLVWPAVSDIRKKQILAILSKNSKVRITRMAFIENEKAFVINYIYPSSDKLCQMKLNCKNEISDFDLLEIFNATSWENYVQNHEVKIQKIQETLKQESTANQDETSEENVASENDGAQ